MPRIDYDEYWFVLEPGQWENDDGPAGWYAVGNDDDSIIAYFATGGEAELYRLLRVNRSEQAG